jgi:hypothetical protein
MKNDIKDISKDYHFTICFVDAILNFEIQSVTFGGSFGLDKARMLPDPG